MAGHPETEMMTATHLAGAPWPPPGSPLLDPARYLGRFFLQHKTQERINRGAYPDRLESLRQLDLQYPPKDAALSEEA